MRQQRDGIDVIADHQAAVVDSVECRARGPSVVEGYYSTWELEQKAVLAGTVVIPSDDYVIIIERAHLGKSRAGNVNGRRDVAGGIAKEPVGDICTICIGTNNLVCVIDSDRGAGGRPWYIEYCNHAINTNERKLAGAEVRVPAKVSSIIYFI